VTLTLAQAEAEIAWLLAKISESEDFINRAEKFFAEKHRDWSDEAVISFEKFLERKREQVYCEQTLVEKLGWSVAMNRSPES